MSVCFYMVSMTITLAICNLRYYIYLHCLIHCIVTIFLKCTCTIKLCSIFCLIYFRVFVKINLYQCQCQCQCHLCYLEVKQPSEVRLWKYIFYDLEYTQNTIDIDTNRQVHVVNYCIAYTVGEHKTFSSSRKILSIVIIWYWLQCY